jgi:hypothetical protein
MIEPSVMVERVEVVIEKLSVVVLEVVMKKLSAKGLLLKEKQSWPL